MLSIRLEVCAQVHEVNVALNAVLKYELKLKLPEPKNLIKVKNKQV